jgi:hypothetical protein
MCSWRTSNPNFTECVPFTHIMSSVNWDTWLTRSTNGCWASPRLKNPVTAMLARPCAAARLCGTPMK